MPPPADPDVPQWLTALWAEAHTDEPAVPAPTQENLDSYGFYGVEPRLEDAPAVRAWWQVIDRLGPTPSRHRLLVLVEDTDAPGLSEHLAAVRSLDAKAPITVVATGTERAGTTPDPAGAGVVHLADVPELLDLDRFEKARLLADLAVQLEPRVLHLWGHGAGFDALQWHGAAMSHGSDIHLTVTGDGLDGPLTHPLLGRPPGYLAPVSTVWVDSGPRWTGCGRSRGCPASGSWSSRRRARWPGSWPRCPATTLTTWLPRTGSTPAR